MLAGVAGIRESCCWFLDENTTLLLLRHGFLVLMLRLHILMQAMDDGGPQSQGSCISIQDGVEACPQTHATHLGGTTPVLGPRILGGPGRRICQFDKSGGSGPNGQVRSGQAGTVKGRRQTELNRLNRRAAGELFNSFDGGILKESGPNALERGLEFEGSEFASNRQGLFVSLVYAATPPRRRRILQVPVSDRF